MVAQKSLVTINVPCVVKISRKNSEVLMSICCSCPSVCEHYFCLENVIWFVRIFCGPAKQINYVSPTMYSRALGFCREWLVKRRCCMEFAQQGRWRGSQFSDVAVTGTWSMVLVLHYGNIRGFSGAVSWVHVGTESGMCPSSLIFWTSLRYVTFFLLCQQNLHTL